MLLKGERKNKTNKAQQTEKKKIAQPPHPLSVQQVQPDSFFLFFFPFPFFPFFLFFSFSLSEIPHPKQRNAEQQGPNKPLTKKSHIIMASWHHGSMSVWGSRNLSPELGVEKRRRRRRSQFHQDLFLTTLKPSQGIRLCHFGQLSSCFVDQREQARKTCFFGGGWLGCGKVTEELAISSRFSFAFKK